MTNIKHNKLTLRAIESCGFDTKLTAGEAVKHTYRLMSQSERTLILETLSTQSLHEVTPIGVAIDNAPERIDIFTLSK